MLPCSSGGAEGLVLYCNYAKRAAGEQFNPYELRVVRMHDAEVRRMRVLWVP